jgi:NTP pyrophosphatase (non-canonical NTP hydrolase)
VSTKQLSIEEKLCRLADANFGRDLGSRIKKLLEEVGELAEAIQNEDRKEIEAEAADCSFVLMDIVHIAGGSLSAAQAKKWGILMERQRDGALHKAARSSSQEAINESVQPDCSAAGSLKVPDTDYRPWPVCPYCGWMFRNASMHHAAQSGIGNCTRCQRAFSYRRDTTILYSTWKLPNNQPKKHDDRQH